MLFTESVYVGVELAGRRGVFTFAALDRDLNLIALADGDTEELVAFLGAQASATTAVNAPSHVNRGLLKRNFGQPSLTSDASPGLDSRVAEYELRRRGIIIRPTEAREELCPAWAQGGFVLYKRLARLGFKTYPQQDASHQSLETQPHACYCTLLGLQPLPKQSLEGRLQRQLALYERGALINDPMNFFDEITRHNVLTGILPGKSIYRPEQLDAMVAAYTAWLAALRPHEVMRVGHRQEGFIILPVPVLKEKY